MSCRHYEPKLASAKCLSNCPSVYTVFPKKYAHSFCFAVLCYGYTLTDFPISIRLTSLALWQSNDCPSASKATLMNMDKYFMWIHYERLHNHNKAKHNKTLCIFLGIYCMCHTTVLLHQLIKVFVYVTDILIQISVWDVFLFLCMTSLLAKNNILYNLNTDSSLQHGIVIWITIYWVFLVLIFTT